TLDYGVWPQRKLMGVQRGYGLDAGDSFYLKIDDKVHQVESNGVLYNAAHPSPFMSSEPMFFTTGERFTQLIGEPNRSLILAAIPNYSEARIQAAADLMQHDLEKQDIEVKPAMSAPGGFKTRTTRPDQFTNQDALDSIFFILSTMAVAMLILGLFLVYNTINAIIAYQVSQIGMMKAIGARIHQILWIYFILVLVYAVLALLIAVPLGALAAHGLRTIMVKRVGMIPGPFAISQTAVVAQIAIALLSPLLVSLVPIVGGARVTVREAISTYGVGRASGLLDRLLIKLQFIPRLVTLTISNTFSNKKRVLFTQFSLVGAGAVFMMVMNTRTTLTYTFDDALLSIYRANVMLELKDEARISVIERIATSQPEVEAVEVWGTAKGTTRLKEAPASNEDDSLNLRGVPVPTTTYIPAIRAGRWLQPGDEYAVVLSNEMATEMGVDVGDWITIDIPTRRESHWQVVGLVFEPVDQESGIVPRNALLKEIGQVGRGTSIKVQTWATDAGTEAAVADQLRTRYETQGYEVLASNQDTAHRLVAERSRKMALLFIILTGMASMTAIVGAVALSGTLTINVLDRTREIGIMRAIGASAWAVAGQFMGEGLILAWLSWLLAIPLSIPVGRMVINTLAQVMNIELIFQVSPSGFLYWLIIVTLLAVIASWFPAQKAAQTSVRESLAYA
ncbi:MAG: ABC transporter permease, partial [Anaerolineae bacterium]|nr:ABC transporter permease [Anaerolineae bacterium]